jgi:outer membrane protein assembly factor BamB/O-antigen ligase
MRNVDLAQWTAVLGAAGALLVLLARRPLALVGGLIVLGVAEAGLAVALVPEEDLDGLVAGPLHVALVLFGVLVVAAGAAILVRYPAAAPVVLLAAAPFRIPISLGAQEAFLLVPLYGVLAAAVLALIVRLLRGEPLRPLPWLLAVPAAGFVAVSAVSLIWSIDVRAGSIELLFFLFPFAAIVAVVANSPLAAWSTRALAATVIALACLFAAIGLWQNWTRQVFFARDVEAINAYTTFFRVTSLFKDPSLYGRNLVIGLAIVLLALWLRRLHVGLAAALVALLWLGLFYSYSQSSLVTLFVATLAITVVAADPQSRKLVLVASLVVALVAAAASAAIVQGESLRSATSGRSRLVEVTVDAFQRHPFRGAGIGAQPLASSQAEGNDGGVRRNASHTTPLTIAAELGLLGIVLYLALLAASVRLLLAAVRRNRELGLGLAAVFLVLVVHSLFYSGFFQDPLTWGVLALAAAVLAPVPTATAVSPQQPAELLDALRGRLPALSGRARKATLVALAVLALLAVGLAVASTLRKEETKGGIDTELEGVTVAEPTARPEAPPVAPAQNKRGGSYRFLPDDRLCWPTFGQGPRRSLSLERVRLGKPTKHFWVKGLGSYIEYPPSYCDGYLYVNSYNGTTYAIDALSGRIIWTRKHSGPTPSTPAIAGPRLIVSSTGGTVTAFARANGKVLWRLRVNAKVESSPVVVDRLVSFGATDGRMFAVYVGTGRVKWAYDTGGRINASPSIVGRRVCITTYAGSIFCLDRNTGRRLWSTYIRRDFLRYESFYASASSDGRRLFTLSRAGKVVALSAATGRVLWTHSLGVLGYSTPAVAHGRVFVGDFNGILHCYRASDGRELWRRRVGGRILGPALVVGDLVFFSTLEERTYAARIRDGRVVWRIGMGKYAPGIATDRHYFFSLNGILIAFRAQNPIEYRSKG